MAVGLVVQLPNGQLAIQQLAPVAAAAAAPTPPPTSAAASTPGDDREPNWGFSKRLEAAFRALGDVPVQARAFAAQGLGKESLTEQEFRRVRKSLQTLGKRIRDKLDAEGNPIEAVWITVPGRRPGTTVHELAFRRKSGAKGVMS